MKKLILYLLLITAIHQTLPAQDRARWRQVFPKNVPPARSSFGMAKLTDGKVLMFGGKGFGTNSKNDTWIFDYKTKDWIEIFPTNIPGGRNSHKIAQISDGKVLIYGGQNNDSSTLSTWIFDINIMDWKNMNPKCDCNFTNQYSMCKLTDGKIIYFGGNINKTSFMSQITKVYDYNLNQWFDYDILNSPGSRSRSELAYLNENNVLMYGGYNDSNLKDTWLYNNIMNKWYKIQVSNQKFRSNFSLSEITTNKLLAFGGNTEGTDTITPYTDRSNDSWIFDLKDSSWKELLLNNKPGKRYFHSSTNIMKNSILLFGGVNSNGYYSNDTWIFDYDSTAIDDVEDINVNPKSTYLYPNPANEYVNIKSDDSNTANADKIEIFDALGEKIYNQDITNSQNDMKIDVSSFTRGIYFVKIGTQYKKFVKN